MRYMVQLEKGQYSDNHWICDITRDLDHMSNLDSNLKSLFKHYITYNRWDLQDHLVAIRVPGGTVGVIHFDDNRIITDLSVETDYVVKTYFRNVNKHLRKYIGVMLVLPELPDTGSSEKWDVKLG